MALKRDFLLSEVDWEEIPDRHRKWPINLWERLPQDVVIATIEEGFKVANPIRAQFKLCPGPMHAA